MLKYFINSLDGSNFFFTDFTTPNYHSFFSGLHFYKVIYCKSGKVQIKVDNATVILKENWLLFSGPLQSVSLSGARENQVLGIAFNKSFFSPEHEKEEQSFLSFLFRGSRWPIAFDMTPDEVTDFSAIISCFLNELNHRDGICREVLHFNLKRLFMKTDVKLRRDNTLSLFQPNHSLTTSSIICHNE